MGKRERTDPALLTLGSRMFRYRTWSPLVVKYGILTLNSLFPFVKLDLKKQYEMCPLAAI